MSHILDNPVWSALTTGNKDLSNGNDTAKFFLGEISPFSAIRNLDAESFQILYDMVPFDSPTAIFSNEKLIYPDPWEIIGRIEGLQMLYLKKETAKNYAAEVVSLSEHNIKEMLELAAITNPGPFLRSTIKFGNYEGIFSDNKLVAMAGQRLHSEDYVEISAVCTHPDHLGKGYARLLIMSQIYNIQAQLKIPYLHVRGDNQRAVGIYKDMGFKTRSEIIIYILRKQE